MIKPAILFLATAFLPLPLNHEYEKLVPYRKNNKWGLSDYEGKLQVETDFEFEELGFFTNGQALVQTHEGRFGFISTDGKINYRTELVEYNGKIRRLKAEGILEDIRAIDFVSYETSEFSYFSENGKQGVTLNLPAPVKIEAIYDEIEVLTEFFTDEDRFLILVKKDSKQGIISEKQTLVPVIYDEIIYTNAQDFVIARKKEKFGVITYSNEIIIPFEYSYLKDVRNEMLFVAVRESQWGLVGSEQTYIPLTYDSIAEVISGTDVPLRFCVYLGKKCGLADRQNNLILPIEYSAIYSYKRDDGFSIVDQQKKWGYADAKGSILIKPKYKALYPVSERPAFLKVKTNRDQWGYIRKKDGFEYFNK